ncbi:sequence-specific DNA binding transcription factor [Carex rostrata]
MTVPVSSRNSQKMDPTLPCIVQALRAAAASVSTTSASASTAVTKSPQASTPRCTRSRAAPDWSVADTLVLVEQIAAVDAELWSKSLSSFQKWKIVSDNCAQIGFHRSSNQCKRRWELLVSDYKKIRRWETMRNSSTGLGLGSGSVSYWRLDPDRRERFGLPGLFNFEVYGAMDAVIKIEGSRDIDSELLVIGPIEPIDKESNNANANANNNGNTLSTVLAIPAENAEAFNAIEHIASEEIEEGLQSSEAWDLAAKLQENAEHIQSILKGENGGDMIISDNLDTGIAREKAEELIKSLGGLVQSLDEFTELVKSNGLEKVVALNSFTSGFQ